MGIRVMDWIDRYALDVIEDSVVVEEGEEERKSDPPRPNQPIRTERNGQ